MPREAELSISVLFREQIAPSRCQTLTGQMTMESLNRVDLDWMGKAKYFFALSLALLVVGGASLIKNGGPYYGIDFKGGTVVDVRFAGPPRSIRFATG